VKHIGRNRYSFQKYLLLLWDKASECSALWRLQTRAKYEFL